MDDRSIIDLFLSRSEDAIGEAKRKFGGMCLSIAYRILQNTQDAEECLSDALLRAWNSIPPNEPEPLAPYIGKLTRNLALDRYAYNTAKKRNAQLEEAFEELENCIASSGNAESALENEELGRMISDFLKTLKTEPRIMFVRRYWYGDSYADIAKRFGVPESTVKSSLHRTREKMRKYLGKEGVVL